MQGNIQQLMLAFLNCNIEERNEEMTRSSATIMQQTNANLDELIRGQHARAQRAADNSEAMLAMMSSAQTTSSRRSAHTDSTGVTPDAMRMLRQRLRDMTPGEVVELSASIHNGTFNSRGFV